MKASSSSKSRFAPAGDFEKPYLHAVPASVLLLTPRCTQEYYADYWALDSALVSLELENNVACFMPQTWESQVRLLHRRIRPTRVPDFCGSR